MRNQDSSKILELYHYNNQSKPELFDFYAKKKWQKWKSKAIKSMLLSRKSLRLKTNEHAWICKTINQIDTEINNLRQSSSEKHQPKMPMKA